MKTNEIVAMLIVILGVVGYYNLNDPQWAASDGPYFDEVENKTTGTIRSVDQEPDVRGIKTAKVMLENGSLVSATIPLKRLVAAGDSVTVSILGGSGGDNSYMVFPSQAAYQLSEGELIQ